MTLRYAWALGYKTACETFALNPPTQVDQFVAGVESGKDMPPDPSTDIPSLTPGPVGENPESLPLPGDKAAALNLADLAWYRNQLGEQGGSEFLMKHDIRTQKGIPQDFHPGAPIARAVKPTPQPPRSAPSVLIDPNYARQAGIGVRAARAATPPPIPAAARR